MSNVTEEDVLNALNDRMIGVYKIVRTINDDFNIVGRNKRYIFATGWKSIDSLCFGQRTPGNGRLSNSLFGVTAFHLRNLVSKDSDRIWYDWIVSNAWLASLSGCTSLEEIMLRLSVIK